MRVSAINGVKTEEQKLKTQAMEAKVVAKYLIDLAKNYDDVFTKSEETPPEGEGFFKTEGQELLKCFFFRKTSKEAHKKDILNDPELCKTTVAMCVDTYDKLDVGLKDWDVLDKIRHSNGFDANVYKKDNNIVVAFGATNDKMDVYADSQMAKGEIPDQFQQAIELYANLKEEYPDANFILTGTSLGGSLAELISATDEDSLAVTYNAFGTKKIVERNPELFSDNHNSYNYITKGDIISRCSHHIGETIQKRQTSLIGHSISSFMGYFK